MCFLGLRFLKDQANGLQEFLLANGLYQVSGNSQFAATRGVSHASGRRQHHDGCPGQLRSSLDLLSQGETVHLRHLGIRQNKGKWVNSSPSLQIAPDSLARTTELVLQNSLTAQSQRCKQPPSFVT